MERTGSHGIGTSVKNILFVRNATGKSGKLRPSHFVILGYVIRFYPQQLTGFDNFDLSAIQAEATLPVTLTAFFTKVTHVMDTKIIVIWVGLLLGGFCL